jgi:predicted transcriptional regulator
MSKTKEQRDALKATLKKLREERGPVVDAAVDRNKLRQAARKQVRVALAEGPATVPSLAAATGLATKDVLWHVAAMRKYGDLAESGMDGDYCIYSLVAKADRSDD